MVPPKASMATRAPAWKVEHRVAHVLKAHESLGIHCALPAVNDLIGSDNSRRGQIGTFLFQQIEGPGRRWWRGCARWPWCQPVAALGVEILQRAKAAAVKEVVFHVAEHAFDLSFGGRTVMTMGLGCEAVMVGKVAETNQWALGHNCRVQIAAIMPPRRDKSHGFLPAA